MNIKLLTAADASDIKLPNQPFPLIGRMIVSRAQEKWQYTTELFAEHEMQTFPDEDNDFTTLNQKGFIIGAYEGKACIGLAIFQEDWLKYAYLHDLKVDQAYRNQGVGQQLINYGLAEAQKRGYAGIWTIGQDNNLIACRFYLKCGFRIGGLVTDGYRHTQQEGKSDIYFYLD